MRTTSKLCVLVSALALAPPLRRRRGRAGLQDADGEGHAPPVWRGLRSLGLWSLEPPPRHQPGERDGPEVRRSIPRLRPSGQHDHGPAPRHGHHEPAKPARERPQRPEWQFPAPTPRRRASPSTSGAASSSTAVSPRRSTTCGSASRGDRAPRRQHVRQGAALRGLLGGARHRALMARGYDASGGRPRRSPSPNPRERRMGPLLGACARRALFVSANKLPPTSHACASRRQRPRVTSSCSKLKSASLKAALANWDSA